MELSSTADGEAKLIRSTAQTAMRELRAILGVLRSGDGNGTTLRPAEEPGTRSDIARLVSQSQLAGVDVRLAWRGEDLHDAAAPVRWAVHRVVREALANVHRHAPGAVATIMVDRGRVRIRVVVSNGKKAGANLLPSGTGLGLVGLRERVLVLGGEFTAGPLPHGGFRVTAELPPNPSPGNATTRGETAAVRHTAGQRDRQVRHGTSVLLAGGLVGSRRSSSSRSPTYPGIHRDTRTRWSRSG